MTDEFRPAPDGFLFRGTFSDDQREELRAELESPENLAVKPSGKLGGSFSVSGDMGEMSEGLRELIADNPPILHAHFQRPESRRQRLWNWLTRPLRVKRRVIAGGTLKGLTEMPNGFSAEIGDLVWEDQWVWRWQK